MTAYSVVLYNTGECMDCCLYWTVFGERKDNSLFGGQAGMQQGQQQIPCSVVIPLRVELVELPVLSCSRRERKSYLHVLTNLNLLKINDAIYIFLSMQKSRLLHYFVQGKVSQICISMKKLLSITICMCIIPNTELFQHCQ